MTLPRTLFSFVAFFVAKLVLHHIVLVVLHDLALLLLDRLDSALALVAARLLANEHTAVLNVRHGRAR